MGGYCSAAYKGVGITTFKVPMKNLLLSSVLMMAGLWVSQPAVADCEAGICCASNEKVSICCDTEGSGFCSIVILG